MKFLSLTRDVELGAEDVLDADEVVVPVVVLESFLACSCNFRDELLLYRGV